MASELTPLLPWIAPGIALLGTGVAWGLLRGKLEALEKRLDQVERDSANQSDVDRHEAAIHETRRHIGDAKQDIRELQTRSSMERKP